jgi:hypothetical protein
MCRVTTVLHAIRGGETLFMHAPAETTAYGSAWDLQSGLSVLRARASRLGAHLEPVATLQPEEVAAVMIGVDAWMRALGAADLSSPSRHGTAAIAALARLLTRAAGHDLEDAPLEEHADPAEHASVLAARYHAWVLDLGLDTRLVLEMAAGDLAFGAENTRLLQMASALGHAGALS